ncbi:cysteine-rich receptor-like protein kinase 2 isoform X2 [Prosopis cineraria]|uniref:cysteine-rich receptor-like protein kinase 2 isoform X2 n=1 Tax=Prosopis cineraria TaxID=364024 RepID=UPI00241053F5|nr:cysteine-rich receptor-like protein kinase 2 isoform X2 [Prosopis cineraria]
MLHTHLLPLLTLVLTWSCWILDGVVSDSQANILKPIACTPFNQFVVSNITIFEENKNATLRDIRDQISDQNKLFVTAQQGAFGNPAVSTLFQCRNYLPVADCVACFDVAAPDILSCPAGAPGAHVAYDGCFLRYDVVSTFFDDTTDTISTASCGNQTITEEPTTFTSSVQQVLKNLQTVTPTTTSFFAATKMKVPNNNNGPTTIFAIAQCTETLTQSTCESCLSSGSNNMQICLPNSEGRAIADGCFMRYSTTSFFPDNYQTSDITPSFKQGSSNIGVIIGGVVGGVALVSLILLVLFCLTKRPKRNKEVPRGEIIGARKLKGPGNYSYRELMSATKNFSEENKLGEGGFGVVYKGVLKNGKVVAVKKLTLRHLHSNKVEEEFESEVKLISNVHHRNLIRLLGYCSHGCSRILVYEYMKNKSLDYFLFGKKKDLLS